MILALVFGYVLILAIAIPLGVALGILWLIFNCLHFICSPRRRRASRVRRYYAHPERYR